MIDPETRKKIGRDASTIEASLQSQSDGLVDGGIAERTDPVSSTWTGAAEFSKEGRLFVVNRATAMFALLFIVIFCECPIDHSLTLVAAPMRGIVSLSIDWKRESVESELISGVFVCYRAGRASECCHYGKVEYT